MSEELNKELYNICDDLMRGMNKPERRWVASNRDSLSGLSIEFRMLTDSDHNVLGQLFGKYGVTLLRSMCLNRYDALKVIQEASLYDVIGQPPDERLKTIKWAIEEVADENRRVADHLFRGRFARGEETEADVRIAIDNRIILFSPDGKHYELNPMFFTHEELEQRSADVISGNKRVIEAQQLVMELTKKYMREAEAL